ncbi:MAG: hypothetical protein ACP5NW_04385 [Candidatus Woesearchaeota archaeon]
MKYSLEWFFIILILGIVSAYGVFAAPTGPSYYENLGSSSYPSAGAANISAVAGNVTELNFEANTSTGTWQGYFGNITGTIVLGNANNQSLYNWNLTSPAGQIYATRLATVPTWSSIQCADSTDIATEDSDLGVNQTRDQDSVNRTFLNTTSFSPFYVGGVNIDPGAQTCYATHLNDETGAPSSSFAEVLLHDTNALIYTALITAPTTGFDGLEHQFQMLVGEDGHDGDTSTTPYYFYLELH